MKRNIYKLSLLFIAIVFFSSASLAAPHYGTVMLFNQPDGSKVKVKVWGDEYYQRVESLDGYTLIRDTKGWICYAKVTPDQSEYVSTDIHYTGVDLNIVKQKFNASKGARQSFPELTKSMRLKRDVILNKRKTNVERLNRSYTQKQQMQGLDVATTVAPAPAAVQSIKGLTLLIDFSDEPAVIDKNTVERYFNQPGFTEFSNNGSIRDYFLDVSGGKLDYTNTVVGYYRAQHPKTYYDGNTPYGKTGELIGEALTWLDGQGFDFSTLTSENGLIKAINFFYAGYPTQGWTYGLWPHMGGYFFSADGVSTNGYELTNIGMSLTMGTICHENGHLLMGWPDLYDYGYESAGLGNFCLMAYQGASNNPVPPNPYLRYSAGWENVTNISSVSGSVSLTSNSLNSLKFDNPFNPYEYFMVESRTLTGRNASLPDEGMLIWHIDQTGGSNSNEQMTPDMHYLVSLEQADGFFDIERSTGYNFGGPGDGFNAPYRDKFNDYTFPNAAWWDGTRSNLSISNISAVGATMTAQVGQSLNTLPVPAGLTVTQGADRLTLNWTDNCSNETGFAIERKLSNGLYKQVATVGPNTSIYADIPTGIGTYVYRVYAFNQNNGSPYSAEASGIYNGQTPYFGTPFTLPGLIEVENYDVGGESIAYHDLDAANSGGQYRTGEGVDIESCAEGGYSLGWLRTGEWIEYTVQVSSQRHYILQSRVASGISGATFHVELDGVNISGPITVPNTGGWQNWQTLSITTPSLSPGLKTLRIVMDSNDFNLNSIRFEFSNVPEINSSLSATGKAGTSFTYNVTALNNPVSFDASGLPSGLSINTTTGVISGTPAFQGTYFPTIQATNGYGTDTKTLMITIDPNIQPPVIMPSLTAFGAVGTSFTYFINATNSPTSYGATSLPPGLSINTFTGAILGTPTTVGVYSVPITATNSAGSDTKTLTVNIGNKPVITSGATISGKTGTAFTYTIVATNSPTSFEATGLPTGLTCNATTGVISGTPTTVGVSTVSLIAYNNYGSGTKTLTVTINSKPVITSALTKTGIVGTAFSYTITANYSPVSFNATNLPTGLTVNTSTGIISGTPTSSGTTNVSISATNAYGTDTKNLTVTINSVSPPVINSSLTSTGVVGTAFSYSITATNTPTSFNATNLPAGLTVNTATGVIGGTPTLPGVKNVTITASNSAGSNTKTLSLTVSDQAGVVTALKAPGAITVNGNLSEAGWNVTRSFSKGVSGIPNNTATFGILWDNTNLYIGAKVIDASLYSDSPNPWDDDAVEIYIDANYNKLTSYDGKDNQIIKSYNKSTVFTKFVLTGLQHSWAAVSGGYTIEIAIPWTALSITPAAGVNIGFDIGYDDDDNAGVREGQAVWNGTDANYTNTSAFGKLTLNAAISSAPARLFVESSELLPAEESDMTLTPNPVKDGYLTIISSSLTPEAEVQIFTNHGMHVFKGKGVSDNTSIQLNLSDLKAGIYILQLFSGSKVKTGKFIVD